MKFNNLIFSIIIITLFINLSCQKKETKSFSIDEEVIQAKTRLANEVNVVDTTKKNKEDKKLKNTEKCNIVEQYQIPLPTNLLDTQILGKPYFLQLYPIDSVDFLIKSYSKAFFFGVYITDLVYATIYDNKNLFYQYYATVVQLSDDLGLKQTFTTERLEKFRENYRSDTVANIINTSITKTCKILEENNQIGILPFMIVGSWAESIYLTIGNVISNQNVPINIYSVIASQDEVIEKLKKLIDDNLLEVEDFKLSNNLHELRQNLDVLKKTYTEVYISNNISIDKQSLTKLYKAFAQLKEKYH